MLDNTVLASLELSQELIEPKEKFSDKGLLQTKLDIIPPIFSLPVIFHPATSNIAIQRFPLCLVRASFATISKFSFSATAFLSVVGTLLNALRISQAEKSSSCPQFKNFSVSLELLAVAEVYSVVPFFQETMSK
tara:strand:+ start:1168 stop:1569 length:402 start_codon:yes stop_codon:yes gene_type:complete